MNYAVLFKAHFWNIDVERQYNRVLKNTNNADIFVVVDVDAGHLEKIPTNIKIFKTHHSDLHQIGLFEQGGFWFNGDYQGILFFLKNPQYDYYVTIEYDVATFANIDFIVNDMRKKYIDAVFEDIEQPLDEWPHLVGCLEYYNFRDIEKGLFCISFFSRRMMAALYARRLAQTQEKTKNNLNFWPIGEAVMASEVKICGMTREKLSNYCSDLKYYRWNQGMTEEFVTYLSPSNTFLHPVSDIEKCIKSNSTSDIKIVNEELLKKSEIVKNFFFFCFLYNLPKNTEEDRNKVFSLLLKYFGNNNDYKFLTEKIISEGKDAVQSSLSPYSYNDHESSRALRHLPSGKFSFHTEEEDNPFWEVDLSYSYSCVNIYIFDRPDVNRSEFLSVSVGETQDTMRTIFQNNNGIRVGTIFSAPLVLKNIQNVRYVRVNIEGKGMLHLDSVIITEVEYPSE